MLYIKNFKFLAQAVLLFYNLQKRNGQMDGRTDGLAQLNMPLNFFEVGSIKSAVVVYIINIPTVEEIDLIYAVLVLKALRIKPFRR